jgi:hypothetical protein
MKEFCIDELSAHNSNLSDQILENAQPIPYINTDINTYNNLDEVQTDTSVQEVEVCKQLLSKEKDATEEIVISSSAGALASKGEEPKAKEDDPTRFVNKIITIFREFNPMLSYAHKGHRNAIFLLREIYGEEMAEDIVRMAIKVQGEQYAPVITTPIELVNKFKKLELYVQNKKDNK